MYTKNTDNDAKHFTRGGQITFHNIRMWVQVNKTVLNMYFPVLMILISISIYAITPNDILWCAVYWCKAQANSILELLNIKMDKFPVLYNHKIYLIPPKNFLNIPLFVKKATAIIFYIKISAAIGFVSSLGVFYAITRWLTKQGEQQAESRFVRGAKLDTPENVAKLVKKDRRDSDITIDGMPIIKGSETKHFLVHGSTGSGKTQLISKFLDHLRRRGDKVFIYDKGGVYTPIFYQKNKDKILNPFDIRCENWDLWYEARTATDFDNISESLIPMHGDTDPFWVNAARTIFSSAAFTMQKDNERSIEKLLLLLLSTELKNLEAYLKNTEATTLASDKIEKTAISVRSVITTYLKSLKFLISTDKPEFYKPRFSIKEWVCNNKDNGWLFLSSKAEQHASIKPLISMWFSMATIALLSLPENRDRRIWFVCDELPSLHKLPQLPESIAEARKFGGCFILGMQSYAQLEKVYGRSAAPEIFDLMNTAFFFRSPSNDMAELVARSLGSQEIEDMRENYSYGANTIRDGISIGSQRMVNQIVTPAEIMDLEEMKCYLRLAASYPISLLKLTLSDREKLSPAFISKPPSTTKGIEPLLKHWEAVMEIPATEKTDTETKETVEQKVTENKSDEEDLPNNILKPAEEHGYVLDE